MVTLYDSVSEWVAGTPDIKVATVFGSQARARIPGGEPVDVWADVDLQIVTTRPGAYFDRSWAEGLRGQTLQVYAKRAVFGGVYKFTALFPGTSVDLVVVPYHRLTMGRWAFAAGLHRHHQGVRKALMEFAFVMRPTHLVIKGGPGWARFYARAVAELPRVSLTNDEAVDLGDIAFVDAVWILGRLQRGELVAAQRWLHRSVIETNLRLAYELHMRREQPAFPDGRRVEKLFDEDGLNAVRFEARLTRESLHTATVSAVERTRWLLTQLTGKAPSWPEMAAI